MTEQIPPLVIVVIILATLLSVFLILNKEDY